MVGLRGALSKDLQYPASLRAMGASPPKNLLVSEAPPVPVRSIAARLPRNVLM